MLEQDPVKRDLLFLGTEFGLYVSLNGGASWMKWTHGVPTASVMALVVHPREHDLVIGTHGRSAFVLDDIRPLRELTPETMTKPLHLFAIADAIQYRPNQTAGPGSPGHGEFRGANRPYGALLTFALRADDLPHPNEEVERQRQQRRRQAAGEEAESEEGEGEGREDEPRVTIEVSDANGDVVRTFRRPVKLGVNRIAWDLRRDGFKRPRIGQRPPQFQPGGPQVLPGTYTVKVKYGQSEATGSVNVLPDPRYDIPQSERVAKHETLMHVGALSEVLTDAVERIRDTRSEIDDVLKLARKTGAEEPATSTNGDPPNPGSANRALMKAGRELKEKLDELEKMFWTPPGTTKGIQRVNNTFRRIGYVGGSLGSSWDAPTPAQLTYLQQAESLLEEALAELNRVFGEDVAAFRGEVEAAGISFLEPAEPLQMPTR